MIDFCRFVFCCISFSLLTFHGADSFSLLSGRADSTKSTSTSLHLHSDEGVIQTRTSAITCEDSIAWTSTDTFSRRLFFQKLRLGGIATASLLSLAPVAASHADDTASNSASKKAGEESGLVSADRVANLLRSVPTFTIVDQKGVPYMVVGEDAKVTGYFFTEYGEADRILKLAKSSADKSIKESKKDPEMNIPENMENPWNQARISTIPLDAAVAIVTKSMYTKNYFQISPSDDDVDDALAITGKKDLAEGKVPLFYYEDFSIEQQDGTKQSPLFFRKSELERSFLKTNPGKPLPEAKVSELFAVLAEMVKPNGTDEELKTLAFIAPTESKQKAKECEKNGRKEPAFLLGKRNLVL